MFLGLDKLDVVVRKGSTFILPIRVQTSDVSWVAVHGITKSAPAIVNAPSHGCPVGWPITFHTIGGMVEVNFDPENPQDNVFRADVIDSDTLSIPTLNTTRFKSFTSGGYISFRVPLQLGSYVAARMDVREFVDGPLLCRLSTEDGTIELDAASHTIWLKLDASQTTALTFDKGVFDIEIIDAFGGVVNICGPRSTFTVIKEVTTGE